MFRYMHSRSFWAISGRSFSWSVQFNFPFSDVLAETSLAKVSGSGSAMSYVRHWTFFDAGSNTVRSVSWAGAPDRAPPLQFISRASSVTLELNVNNMFAHAIGKLYFF